MNNSSKFNKFCTNDTEPIRDNELENFINTVRPPLVVTAKRSPSPDLYEPSSFIQPFDIADESTIIGPLLCTQKYDFVQDEKFINLKARFLYYDQFLETFIHPDYVKYSYIAGGFFTKYVRDACGSDEEYLI